MRVHILFTSVLSIAIVFCLSCELQEDLVPDTIGSKISEIKRRIPATPVPSFQLYCRPRPKTGNNPVFVIVRNEKEPVLSSDLSDINMVNVAKISVLKGEAAVERFGEKGRKGLIIITMK